MKNPCVFACILAPLGFIEILLSAPSSLPLISIASSKSFNFEKHNLYENNHKIVDGGKEKQKKTQITEIFIS